MDCVTNLEMLRTAPPHEIASLIAHNFLRHAVFIVERRTRDDILAAIEGWLHKEVPPC